MSAIRLGTASNIRAFQNLSNALTAGNLESTQLQLIDNEALEDEFGRFRVWSGNLGALQKGHSSLDYRLRDSPLLSSNVLKLLEELAENLTQAFAVVSGARLPYEQQQTQEDREKEKDGDDDDDDFFSEDEDDSETGSMTELEMRFREIVDIIDNLYKLSVRIRTPTITSRSLKAASYQPKDPETGVDLFEQYAAWDLQHTRQLLRDLRMPHVGEPEDDDDVLINRLSRAITLRRRQFKYWRRHRDKLGVSTVSEEDPPAVQPLLEQFDAPRQIDTLEAQPDNPIIAVVKDAPSQRTGKTLLSGTEATYHNQSLDDIMDAKSVTSYATTVRDISGKGIELAPPPKAAAGNKDFECPYCFIICPARYGKGRPWRTHLLQDLQPYVCTYPDCKSSEQLFRSRREWSEHEATHRKAWRCPEHPTAVYKTRSGLENHLRRKHLDSFPESQLDSIIEVGETSMVDMREKCPICLVSADMEGIGTLQNHIANHLERLATFALPSNTDDESDGASSVASRGRTDTSGSQDLSEVSFASDTTVELEDSGIRDSTAAHISAEVISNEQSPPTDTEVLPDHRVLSIESLRTVPDASEKRMDILLSNQSFEYDDFDEQGSGETVEVEEHMAEIDSFRSHMLALPFAKSVRFFRRYGSWRGYTIFEDEASASRAMNLFDSKKFPEVQIRQGTQNKTALKFNIPQSAHMNDLAPSRQSTREHAESRSVSSISLSYDEEDQEPRPPILTVSEIPTLRSLYRSRKLLQRDQSYTPNDTYNRTISFCFYDLTRLKVDAIVNSANRSMKITQSNATLNRYVHKAAGPNLTKECKAKGKVKAGQAIITLGYRIPATHVIHAARPTYSGSKGMGKFNILTECYRSTLRIATDHQLKTIAFCCLGAGGCGFPPRVAARVALQEVREFLDTHPTNSFERIIFCVYSSVDEKAYMDFLPVFFPPTHGDLENAIPLESSTHRTTLATQLLDIQTQVGDVLRELIIYSENMVGFPRNVLNELTAINDCLRSLKDLLHGPKESIKNLNDQSSQDLDLICAVLQSVCGSILEITELAKYNKNLGQSSHETIWDDYNFHMKSSQGMDLVELLEICQDFIQSLEDILVRDGIEPYELATMRVRLGSYALKQTGKGPQGVRDRFDEVMYTREFQRGAATQSRADIIKVHQIPSIARLYQLGELEYRPTNAIPSAHFNYMICLLREDITRLEVDVLVSSTDVSFAGMGTLDRTVFRKGGPSMEVDCASFGICKEGDVRMTAGYLLPAKNVLHTIPPVTYRKNTKDVLRSIYREVLHTASSLKATSVAIPALGTGMLNYPRRDCALLAIEEVKRFLESAEPTNSIEKIIFVVFGSNDEFVYKSLIPMHFPPVDINVNKALPSKINLLSQIAGTTDMSASVEASPTPKRTLFSSIGEAFRSVRFGKQPVTQTTRPLLPGEEHALDGFEAHAQTCPTCNDMYKLYEEKGNLCQDGYPLAQLILQYLYMEADQSVYSLQGDGRVKVEIPNIYPLSWHLLTLVEKSFRDEYWNEPFVSRNLPCAAIAQREEQPGVIPPGVTLYNAEVTVPIQREPEKSIALVHHRSNSTESWKLLRPHECEIHIYPGRIVIHELNEQDQIRIPILSLELTPLVIIQKQTSSELIVERAGTSQEAQTERTGQILFSYRSPAECEMLLQRLKHARNNNPAYVGGISTEESQTGNDNEPTVADLPSVSPHEPPDDIHGREPAIIPKPRYTSSSQFSNLHDPPIPVLLSKRILALLRAHPDSSIHQQDIATSLNADVRDIATATQDLQALNLIHPTNEETWTAIEAALEPTPTLTEQRQAERGSPLVENEPSGRQSPLRLDDELNKSSTKDIDISISGLSTVNIDDFYTYLNQALHAPDPKSSPPPTEEDESTHQIRHPRPTTPDHTQPQPIPAGARWTKLDRRLVNGRALEEANEQFEEREDSIVVFRVLSRDEIMSLAQRTREVRRGKEELERLGIERWRIE